MASRYNWLFTYPDGDSSAELHLVMDRPTKLIMQSKDVLHSLYVPAFRQKMDIVPGRYTYVYIIPTGPASTDCHAPSIVAKVTPRCGRWPKSIRPPRIAKPILQWIKAEHSRLGKWRTDLQDPMFGMPQDRWHGGDRSRAEPDLGQRRRKLHDGRTVKVDDQYIQDSIWYPEKHVVAGYGPVSKMNSFKGQLDEEDINDVISFLKYLNDPSLVSDEADRRTDSEESAAEERNR